MLTITRSHQLQELIFRKICTLKEHKNNQACLPNKQLIKRVKNKPT